MKRVRFLHCADIHLDSLFHMFGAHQEKAEVRRRDVMDVFRRIIDLAEEQDCEFVLICGDLFEHEHVKRSTIDYLCNCFQLYSHIKFLLIAGNHDPEVEGSFYKFIDWPSNVKFLGVENPIFETEDVCFHGAGFRDFYHKESLLKNLKKLNDEKINVLLTHGSVDFYDAGKGYNPISSTEIEKFGLDYAAVGHFHNRLDDIGGKGIIYNPGSPEPLGLDETGVHGVYVVDIEKTDKKVSKKVEFYVTQQKRYWNVEVDLTGVEELDDGIFIIQKKLNDCIPNTSVISVDISGYISEDLANELDDYFKSLKTTYFWIEWQNKTEVVPDLEELGKESGVRGVFARKIREKLSEKDTFEYRKMVWTAYMFGIEALDR